MSDTKTILLGLGGVLYLMVSEVLPFFDSVESNGILHYLWLISKKNVPPVRIEENEPMLPCTDTLIDTTGASIDTITLVTQNSKKIADIYAHITQINKQLANYKTVLAEYNINFIKMLDQMDDHLDNIEENEDIVDKKLEQIDTRLSELEES